MIDFACKQINLDEVIKCSLSLTKAEYKLLNYFITNPEWNTTKDLANGLNLNLSTIQRGVKKLFEKELIDRAQENLNGGGYEFAYKIKDKDDLKVKIKETIKRWSKNTEKEIDKW